MPVQLAPAPPQGLDAVLYSVDDATVPVAYATDVGPSEPAETLRDRCKSSLDNDGAPGTADANKLAAKDMQQLLLRQAELVKKQLLPQFPHIRLPPDKGCVDIQFLQHSIQSSQPATATFPGPKSGYLYPGDGANPHYALLKLHGSAKTEEHPRMTIALWRLVKLKAGRAPLTDLLKIDEAGVDWNTIFEDIVPKVSIVTQVPKPMLGAKRQKSAATSSDGASAGASAGPSSFLQDGVCGSLTVASDLSVGGEMSVHGNATVGGSASIGKDASVGGRLRVSGDLDVGGAATITGGVRSANGDFAEYAPKRHADEVIEEGDVVVQQGTLVSKAFTEGAPPPTGWFVASSEEQACLMGKVAEMDGGCLIAYLGQVSVRVSGAVGVEVGGKLVPSGEGDGCARALAHDELDDPHAAHILGVVIARGSRTGYVHAFVAPGLSGSTSVAPLLDRLQRLEAHVKSLEGTLELVHEASDGLIQLVPKGSTSPASLARWMLCSCTMRLPGEVSLPLSPEIFNAVDDEGERSLAGTLLVLLGWAAEMDEGEETTAEGSDDYDKRDQAARRIFERLSETDLDYQRRLFSKMNKLTPGRVEQFVVQALEVHDQEQASGGDAHSAGRIFGDLIKAELERKRRAQVLLKAASAQPQIPRAYQSELVDKVGARNAIVVAMTATGKSLVAAEIIHRALQRRQPGDRRVVVYLESQRPLVKQQGDKLATYFKQHGEEDADFIGSYVGGNTFIPSWRIMCERHGVVVIIVDLFLQRLQRGEAKISDCIFICFDECHASTKAHSYHKVNQEVKRFAASEPDAPLPQVVGLTATPAWKDTVEDNLMALAQLCENMNDASIVQVEDNLAELEQHTHAPAVDQKHPLQIRDADAQYKAYLPEVMSAIESILSEPFGYDSEVRQALTNAASELRKDRTLTENATAGFSKNYDAVAKRWGENEQLATCKVAKVGFRLAASVNRLYQVTDDVGWESAQCLLGSALFRALKDTAGAGNERGLCLDLVTSVLSSCLCQKRFVEPLLTIQPHRLQGTDECSHPKLRALAQILIASFEGDERPLRGIVFVQTRSSVRRVVNYIKTHPELKNFVRPSAFCGHEEMSSRAQENVMKAFEHNQFNLLISTSVLQEGYDMPDIRLVIMLDGVTSGKVRIQCRGRAMRRKGGAFHVLYYSNSVEATGVWRSQQQEHAAKEALTTLADSGMEAFSELTIGLNPLVTLNSNKKKFACGPDFVESDQLPTGEWTVTVSVTVKGEEQSITATATRPAKNGPDGAKMAAATDLVQKLMSIKRPI